MKTSKKNFILLTLGMSVSQIGTEFYSFATAWYIVEITSSAILMSSYLALGLVVRIIAGPLISVLTEKLNKKKVIVFLDCFMGAFMIISVIILSILKDVNHVISFLMASSVINSIIASIYSPVFSYMFKNILDSDLLLKGNAVRSIIDNVDNILGTLFAGILYSFIGFKGILIVNGVSYFISAISESFIKIDKEKLNINKESYFTGYFNDFKLGVTNLMNEKELLKKLSIIAVLNFLNYGLFVVSIQFIFNNILNIDPSYYSIGNSFMIVGSIIMSIYILNKIKAELIILNRAFKYSVIISIVYSIFLLLIVFLEPSILVIIAIFCILNLISGSIDSYVEIPFTSFMQKSINNSTYTRNVSVIYSILEILTPISAVFSGLIIQYYGVNIFLTIFIIGYMFLIYYFERNKEITSFHIDSLSNKPPMT